MVVGDPGAGKTSLLTRFTDDKFYEDPPPYDNKIKELPVANRIVRIQVWDTAGQETFKSITSSYYRGAQGVLIVFDLSNEESFKNARNKWDVEISRFAESSIIRLLVGTKLDLTGERQVRTEDAEDFARNQGMDYVETSAKDNTQVETVFCDIAKSILNESND
uniref:Uncharacterized protein n=1 Tax=Arcella intermedia TaxID=1963864 RepID=A0A6B2LMW0_9EUKA